MKYIIFSNGGIQTPVIFPDFIQHAEMFDSMKKYDMNAKIISAGSCSINDKAEVVCFGESVSLKVESRNEVDSQIVNKNFEGSMW